MSPLFEVDHHQTTARLGLPCRQLLVQVNPEKVVAPARADSPTMAWSPAKDQAAQEAGTEGQGLECPGVGERTQFPVPEFNTTATLVDRGECGIDRPLAMIRSDAMSMTQPPSSRRSRQPSTTSDWLQAVT